MRTLLTVIVTGALLGGTVFVDAAEGGDKRHRSKHQRVDARQEYRQDGYFRSRDVIVIREYYRPHAQQLPPGLRHRYHRTGYLPRGWARRIRPIPVYVERELAAVPRGYRRGVIDGHVVVHNDRGFILDVAVLF